MPIPRIQHLGDNRDWYDQAPEAAIVKPLSLTVGWVRADGETDEHTATYVYDGALTPGEAVEFADVILKSPGLSLRVNVAHVYLGMPVLRVWTELFDDAPASDLRCEFTLAGPDGVQFIVKCAPTAFLFLHRVGQRLLEPIAHRALESAVKALSGATT